ncbi:retrovirus-related pol polyprotein from transposon TNT 1-94 [Tanacetum coccineum]
MAKASPTQEAWYFGHRRLSHLNFDYINLLSKNDIVIGLPKLKYVKDQLCSSCELSKAKMSSFKTKVAPSSKGWLNLLHMDLCGPMHVESINGKKCILLIIDDYSRYTWTLFLRSKDEILEVLKYFLNMIQRNLQTQVITVRTDRGTKFLNKTIHAYFKEEGIEHQTSTPQTPKQNRSLIIPRHEKTPYHIINGIKPSLKRLYILGCTCYITRDGENLNKMKEKGDSCILVGYFTHRLFEEYFTTRNQSVSKSFPLFDNSKQQDIQPTANFQTTTELITPTTTITAEENNADIQAEDAQIDENEFYNIFSTAVCEEAEPSTHYVDSSNMHTFYQHHQSEHRWTKDHPLEQVHGNPSKPVQTR